MTQDIVTELFTRYSDELYAYLCRYTGDHAMAKDILSDTFLKLFGEAKKETGDFAWRPWLYKVATNRAISEFRRRKIRALFTAKEKWNTEYGSSPHDIFVESEEGERVKKAILKLKDKQRTVLLMRVYQEMSYQEIADALEINIGTVKSRINEAKDQVRFHMEDDDGR